MKRNQICQVNEFITFQSMGRCKSLVLLKSFLWYEPWSSRVTTLVLSHPGSPPRGTAGGGLVAWWLQYPLFTDKAGNIVCSQGQSGETFENKTIILLFGVRKIYLNHTNQCLPRLASHKLSLRRLSQLWH